MSTSPQHILITGGAGFIGSHLSEMLLPAAASITIIDNLSTGSRANLAPHKANPKLKLVEGDLADILLQIPQSQPIDQVYHLAAAVGVKKVIDEPIESIETNILQTATLLHFAASRRSEVHPAGTPILIASSSEVYGKSDKVPFSEDDDVVYGPTTKHRWSYAASKAIDEYLALAHFQQHGLPTVIVRFFNTVGPRQIGSYGMVLPSFVAAALSGKPLSIYGDGGQSRCFCDVRDVVRALPALLGKPSCHGRVFNLGSDRTMTIDQLADLVIKTLGSASEKQYIPYDRAYASGFEDLRQRQPDLTRIRAAIGFTQDVPLTQTILDIAEIMSR
jgi:UDP-glucose 4-epimerase